MITGQSITQSLHLPRKKAVRQERKVCETLFFKSVGRTLSSFHPPRLPCSSLGHCLLISFPFRCCVFDLVARFRR